ncbi:MAG: sulfotransferase domain-containing protein [Candidatus Hodarchaeota archaeon]
MFFRQFVNKRLSQSQKTGIKALLLILKGQVLHIDLACTLKSECKLSNKILIGTHHKTGSYWLSSVFQNICRHYSLTFYAGTQDSLPEQYDVFFQNHSVFDLDSIGVPFRGIHIIRDPRDVIISGCFYHQKSEEEWLHRPRKDLQGLTYQQKINSYRNIDDQILFEMENVGKETICDMLNWDYTCSSFYELKYEDLIEDIDLILFHKIFSFLGFPGSVIPNLLAIAYNKSLFSGLHSKSVHIRSGETNQWKKYFKPNHKDRFLELFGDALIRLGYEKKTNWT